MKLNIELKQKKETGNEITYRKSLYEELEVELDLFKKNNSNLSVAMMDIDRFKQVNDTYGHPVGDLVIKRKETL